MLEEQIKPLASLETDEGVDEYWTRYAELSTREQIRERGFVSWTSNSNKGIAVAVAVQLAAVWLLVQLFG